MKIIQPDSLASAAATLLKTGATPASVKIMAKKSLGLLVELAAMRPSLANILKQEALAVGADAAVHKRTPQCGVESTQAILAGNLSQLFRLAQKLEKNLAEMAQIGQNLKKELTAKFPELR